MGLKIGDPTAKTNERPPAIDFSQLPDNSPLPEGYIAPSNSPKPGSIHELVVQCGGKYFLGSRCFQQEPHWPFAWSRARHDWILRLDADEFPSEELKNWLCRFRTGPEPPEDVSGYTCIWPLWNGRKMITNRWPVGRILLFHRRRVRFFGVAEQVPIPDSRYEPLGLILHHQPNRKSYGVRNALFRRQAYRWRHVIAQSLMGEPTALPCWRWTLAQWPNRWNWIRHHPLTHSIASLVWVPLRQLKGMLNAGEIPDLSECLNPALHHFMLGLQVFVAKQRHQKVTS